MKIQDYFRSIPGGAAQGSVSVAVKKHADDSSVQTVTTDANGLYTVEQSLNPGPVYWEATSGGVKRMGSSKTYGMSGPISVYELVFVLRALGNGKVKGYANQLAVTAGGAGTRTVTVATGAALVNGIPVVIYGTQTVTGSANGTQAARSDVLLLTVTNPGQANEGKAVLEIQEGKTSSNFVTAAGTTSLPLADLSLSAADTYTRTQLDTWLLDTAAFPARSEVKQATVVSSQTADQPINAGSASSILGGSVTLTNNVIYDVVVRVFLLTATTAGAVNVQAWGGSTATAGTAVASASATHQGVEAIFTTTVTGAGAAFNFGALVAKSDAAATASYRSGWAHIQAIPRT